MCHASVVTATHLADGNDLSMTESTLSLNWILIHEEKKPWKLAHRGKEISMNSGTFFGASALALVLSLGVAGAVTAAADDCVSELDAVADAIYNGNFRVKMDRKRLFAKVIQARAKLDLDKCSDSLDKLDSINDKVADLSDDSGKKKLPPEDATAIMDAAGAAAECIALLKTCVSK